MREKIVHVCVNSNGADNVIQAVAGLGISRFLLLTDALSLGPLKSLDTPAGRQARFAYLLKTSATDDDPPWQEYLMGLQERMGLVDLAPRPAPDESVLVWFGERADEQILLRAVCALWPDADIWLADVRRVADRYPVHKAFVPSFAPQALRELLPLAAPLPQARKHALAQEWHALTTQDSLLRAYEGDAIVGLSEAIYDADLLRACTHAFALQGRVAGKVQFEGRHAHGDLYLFYRLQLLADRGLVEIQVCPGDTRSSLVRLAPGQLPPHIEASNMSR